ncbi:unnamed protein product [Schistocephalus solidus]|uniref:Kazal-like domain-containing protein n=1 Tax=Schistocephalus solidus TaxID=70667 RepID=A0A183S7B0_SCHSO|nr:unnamed protein product [Schistocephalus solidus]
MLGKNDITREECCDLRGFFVPGSISETQYVRDMLLGREGVTGCEYACSDGTFETCKNIPCDTGYRCAIQRRRAICECSTECTALEYLDGPVCTTDYRRFRTRCDFIRERCRNQNQLLEEAVCPPVESVCHPKSPQNRFASDGMTDVQLGVHSFSGQASCEEPNWLGPTQNKFGLSDFEFDSITEDLSECTNDQFGGPICATNNHTYKNQCELRQASIRLGMEIRIAYLGACNASKTCENIRCQNDDMNCIYHHKTHQPVCMDCQRSPPNCNPIISSQLSTRTSFQLAQLTQRMTQVFGDPRWHDNVVTNDWPVVCGSNGQTFPNTCFLHVYSCLTSTFIEMVSVGSCSGQYFLLICHVLRAKTGAKHEILIELHSCHCILLNLT